MASWKRPAGAATDRREVPLSAPFNAGALPLDALSEILLRLPGKELCRLRAVCRQWRSLLSDPLFAAAHAARHPEPLIVAGYAEDMNDGILFDIVDLSGHVVSRVRGAANATGYERVVSTQLDLICVTEGASGRWRVVNPGTGVVCVLPGGLAVEHAAYEPDVSHHRISVAMGQVVSTGEYKVLRVLDCFPHKNLQLCEVITLAGSGHIRWTGKTTPPYTVGLGAWCNAVIDAFVYFFSNEISQGQDVTPHHICWFDLITEEWKATIRGPLGSASNDAAGFSQWGEFSLVALNGCLVVAHRTVPCYMNLWFLEDAEKGSWVMQHTIQVGTIHHHDGFRFWDAVHTVRPVLVLNDGRIVLIHIGNRGSLKIYDPKRGTSTDVAEIGPCSAIGLYTGNLLSLANGLRS